MFFCVWLLSLCTMPLRFTQGAMCVETDFLFMAKQYSTVWIYHLFPIRSADDRYLGCLIVATKKLPSDRELHGSQKWAPILLEKYFALFHSSAWTTGRIQESCSAWPALAPSPQLTFNHYESLESCLNQNTARHMGRHI